MRPRTPLAILLALAATPALAFEPPLLAGGRLRVGGEASFVWSADDRGYFNFNDYEHSLIRMLRLSGSAELRLGSRLSLLGEVRTDNFDPPRPYALYARIRPWADRNVDVQVGRIPPVFGSFPRRRYGPDNVVIGMPLAYQYLTSLRPDAIPGSADDFVPMRGEGWLVRYPVGASRPAPGLPLVSGLRWDTGVEVRLGSEPLHGALAITQGSLGNPRFRDDNDGKQVVGRVAWAPVAGLVLGTSGARGAYLDRELLASLPSAIAARPHRQRALGLDLEYSRDYWLLRTEAVWSAWDVPAVSAPLVPRPLRATAVMVEGRYKVVAGGWVAARVDHLGFTRVTGSEGPFTWDAPVTRFELGGGYAVHRNVLVKAAWQRNRREGGTVPRQDFLMGQILLWF